MEEIDIEQTDESVIEGFPDWSKVDNSQLAKLLAERVIYNADNLVAFDKPAGLAYSGLKSSSCVKIESALQDIKKIVAPDCERLNVVESLDKCASGILIFAKSKERQKQLKDMIDQGKVTHRFRALVKGVPENLTADINIPLRKTRQGSDVRWVPLIKKTSDPISHEITRYRLVNQSKLLNVSLVDLFVNTSSVHQVRSHLGLGLNCPLLGEAKYNYKKNVPIKMGKQLLDRLGVRGNRSTEVPLSIHLAEVIIPLGDGSRYSVIKANYPQLFMKIVKSLSLFRK